MQVLHARIHRARLRELIAAVPVFGDRPPEPVILSCPTCGDEFFADLAPYEEPFDLEELEWEALTWLDRECPDHAHRFEVGA